MTCRLLIENPKKQKTMPKKAKDVEMEEVSLDEPSPAAAEEPKAAAAPKKESKPPVGKSIYFDNSIDLFEEICDAESGESVLILFGFVTTKNDEGDTKLEKMCAAMNKAGVFYHSYDAKSGGSYRITRIGATKSRLEKFADAIDFVTGLDRDKIKKACEDIGLILKNPSYGKGWYDPYAHLSGGYEVEKKELYCEFTSGDFIKLLFLILVGSPNFKDGAKGCGFDITKLNSTEKDDAFCLAFFPLHDNELKAKLERRWLPLDWPWNMPSFEIKEYLGEELAFYFAFLAHLTSGQMPLIPIAIGTSGTQFIIIIFIIFPFPFYVC
jgi:hypothetical protein